ncbi:MAG: metal ABC transporter ATP-binding protein [Chloroflexi bacterium]|nr:metal ABC transporter ATP-binding protein [Chloroflexota bacterium]
MTPQPPALAFDNVSVAYSERIVLAHVTVDIAAGEFVGIVGPNGAGKSTLLNAVLGIAPHVRGNICVYGRACNADARSHIAYMPQREAVDWTFPITVEGVVLMGRQRRIGWFRRPGPRDRAVVDWALEQVEMHEWRRAPIGALSGGQQQRVFLARALAEEGDVLMLDEPMTGVDAPTQETILRLLQGMRQRGQTVLMTTHDLGVARMFCSKLMFLHHTLIAYGAPADVFNTDVLQRTYGGHVMRLSPDEVADDALLVLKDDTHHHHAEGGGHIH